MAQGTLIKGLEVLLYVDVNGKKEVVAGQRGASLSMSADELDITDKTTRGYKAFLVGLKEWTISCDGLVCIGDKGYDALVAKFLAGETIGIELKAMQKNAETNEEEMIFGYSGSVAIASMDFDAQYDDAFTYSCELKGASALVNMMADTEE